jgi:hypothetical protein
MKLSKVAVLSAAIVLVGGGSIVAAKQPSTRIEYQKGLTEVAAQTVAGSGTFVQAEKPTQGNLRIVTVNGTRFLELDSSFKTSSDGPDLHVILYRDKATPAKVQEGDYIVLGRLQKFDGAQRYSIPSGVNLADYGSVAIWCRMFNATFGYAPLKV